MKPISNLTAHNRRVKEIRDRVENTATEGPWKMVWDVPDNEVQMPKIVDGDDDPVMEALYKGDGKPGDVWIDAFWEDIEFMAHSREDIPYLLDRVETLTKALKYYANGGDDKRVAREALNGEEK